MSRSRHPGDASSYTFGGRFKVPGDVYHSVPPGWRQAEILVAHRNLGGRFPLVHPEDEQQLAGLKPDWREWYSYHLTLRRVDEGLRADEYACVELAVRYLEQRHIVSGSGYFRQTLARHLRKASLNAQQIHRLNGHFFALVKHRDFTSEFRAYLSLWHRILLPETRAALMPYLEAHQSDPRWHWLKPLVAENQ